jgi:hypothetical protein
VAFGLVATEAAAVAGRAAYVGRMAVSSREISLHEHISQHDKGRVRRWRGGVVGGWLEQDVSLGWYADGAWWVEHTREINVWVFTGDDERKVRAAAEAKAADLMAGGEWWPTVATYEPGAMPGRAATVAEWPPGHEPA